MINGLKGSVTFVGNAPILTGSFSGLDTGALIEAQLQIKRLPAVRLENRITENDTKIASFNQLSGLLATLRSAADGLRNPPGISGLQGNIFERKATFLTSGSTTPATTLVGVTAAASAAAGTFEIEVLQLARAHKVSGTSIADTTADLGITETLTVGVSGGTSVDIAVGPDADASEIVAAINGTTATSGVRASLLKVADGDYRVVLTAMDTNKTIAVAGSSGQTLTALGLSTDNGATFATVLQAPQPSQVAVDGLVDVIERDGNEIGDLMPGITIDLYKAEPGTTVRVDVESDLAAVRQQISDFVDAYNAVRAFVAEQQKVTEEGELSESAVLFGDNTVRQLGQRLGSDLAAMVDGLPEAALSTLRSVGIELDKDNFLKLDTAKLDGALVDKLDEVRGVLEFGFAADSPNLRVVGRSASFAAGDFTVDITGVDGDGTITGASVAGYGSVFDISGNLLIGKEGTAFEGVTLAYVADAGSGAASIAVSTSLGIAERLYQTVESFTKPNGGLIPGQIASIGDQNERFQEQIRRIDERLLDYQKFLIAKYQALETAIAQADAVNQQLRAMLGFDDDDR
jgi:flagellar hook-associated protein 2